MQEDDHLENLLKCPICYDFYNVCMITKCSHDFCSLCIRKYLSVRAQCPVCFENASEPELRNNRLVDNIVAHYKSINKSLKQCLNTSTSGDISIISEDASQNEPSLPSVETVNELGDSELTPNKSLSQIESSNKALCPVCEEFIKIEVMNAHLDICLTRGERKESLRKGIFPDKDNKMPKVVYHLYTDSALQAILEEIGLNTEGSRVNWIRRHKEFTILYNAECDSLQPRPILDLIKQVHKEEAVEKRPRQIKLFQLDKKSDLAIIEKEQEKYLKENESHYNKLVDDVQNRLPIGSNFKTRKVLKNKLQADIDAPSTSTQKKVSKRSKSTEKASSDEEPLLVKSSRCDSPTF